MPARRALATLIGLVCLGAAPPATAAVSLDPVGTFAAPIYAAAPPGDGLRLMVVERAGAIRVVRDGAVAATAFLDISAQVDQGGEGGLLSVAFPADYVASRRFYVFLTPNDSDPGPAPIQVREYLRSGTNPDRADASSGRVVLTVPHPTNTNHYGGQLHFGPDGLLYVSIGDGGGSGDPFDNAQNLSSRLGKILRLDPRQSGTASFSVPASNPFVGAPGDDLIWSYGLRNPFRFSFDRTTGDLVIGDVGQNFSEEIDFLPSQQGRGRGADLGWDDCEGPFDYPIAMPAEPCTRLGDVAPVHSYEPVGGCRAITGGVVVRDPALEELAGRYVYGDFCQEGLLRSIQLATPTATGDADLGVDVPNFNLAAFGEDACGGVHTVELGTGAVSRLEDGTPLPCLARVTYPASSLQSPTSPPSRPPAAVPALLQVTLGGSRRQRALRRHAVLVRMRCSAACTTRGLGSLSVRGSDGRRLRLRGTLRVLAGGEPATLRLAIPRRARAAAARRLGRGRRVTAALTIRVRDLSGRLTVLERSVRILR